MKLTTGILAMAMMVGGVWAPKAGAQNSDAIDNARSVAKSLQQTQANNTKAAPASTKPAPGAPAPAVKPAAIPGDKPVSKAQASAVKAPDSGQHNQLQHVNVVPGTDNIQIEISSSETVTPKVSKLSSPARVVVELPETVVASSQNKIPVGSGGVKGVRIGMDGKTPPTTSVVVDLEKALAFEVAPGPAGKVILIVHTQDEATTSAKNTPAPVAKKPVTAAPSQAATAKPAAAPQTQVAAKTAPAPKVTEAKATAPKATVPAPKAEPKQQAKTVVAAKQSPIAAVKEAVAAKTAKTAEAPKPEEKKWAMSGKRDPFFSPVVQQNGSGCSTGKKCLEIGAINLRGVVKSDNGFIAVVTNNLNKAYFLRENDPVFNGYVVKITGDSVVFQETIQDKLGKSFTREVVKRIFTPAV
jgi:Tfp pilus assembly protein PilP